MVNYTKPETRKRTCDRKLSSFSSRENGSTVISKDDRGKLSWDHKHVLVLDFLDHGDTVCCLLLWGHLAYGGHCLQNALVTLPKYCPFA